MNKEDTFRLFDSATRIVRDYQEGILSEKNAIDSLRLILFKLGHYGHTIEDCIAMLNFHFTSQEPRP